MAISEIVLSFVWIIGFWLVIVFGIYAIIIATVKPKSPSSIIRALYGLFFIVVFIYSIFYAPYKKYLEYKSIGFYISIAVLLLLFVVLIISGMNRSSRKGGR